jgi:xylulokinase
MPHVLTFDLGTTYLKAGLFDDQARPLTVVRRPTPIERPQPTWSQMDVDAFRTTIAALSHDLRQLQPIAFADVRCLSFATQSNSFLLRDKHDHPLTPILIWNDARAMDLAPWVHAIAALPEHYARTGVADLSPHMALAKLHWLAQHQSDLHRQARRFCLLSDDFTLWLTGRHLTEAGAAGLTGLLDIHRLEWWPPALVAAAIDPALLPQPVRVGADAGPLLPEPAAALGLSPQTRLIVGCLDQYAGALGAHCTTPGSVCETTGTVLAVVSLADRFDPSLAQRGVFQGPAFRAGLFYRMAFSTLGAGILEHYQRQHAPHLTFDQLDAAAAQSLSDHTAADLLDAAASQGQGLPVFRTPPTSHGQAALAIYHAVARRCGELVDAVCGQSRPASITCLGGAARSALWRSLKAQVTGTPMLAPPTDEPTSRGAAVCALRRFAPGE